MKLVNFTRQLLHLYDVSGALVELKPDPRYVGLVAVGEHLAIDDDSGHRFSYNVRRVTEVKGLPEPDGETFYIVPVEVAMAVQSVRDDVVFPSEDAHIRSQEGELVRITHLRRIISRIT